MCERIFLQELYRSLAGAQTPYPHLPREAQALYCQLLEAETLPQFVSPQEWQRLLLYWNQFEIASRNISWCQRPCNMLAFLDM